MARLIESEADHSSSSALDNPTSATLNTNGKMSSVEILNNTTSSPRKFSFKTKQYNHNHYQPKLVTSKIKINPNSTVAELANKFNTIIVDDGDKTNRHHVILKRKHSVGNNNTVIKELPNNVKEAIRLFEQSNSKERNNNVKKDSEPKSNEQTKKSSKIILIRKNSIQRVKKIASTGDISTQIKSESYSNLKRSEIDLKGTSCETCLTLPQLRPTLSLGSNINAPMKIRRPSSIGNSLNQNTSSNQNKTSKSECENLLSNIRKNLRHTSMINLNNSSHRSDHSYEHKISDKYLINKYNTLKPELKPKPEQDFIKDRRKSVSDIQILFKNTNQDLINSKVVQNNFPQRTKFQLKSNKNQNVEQVKKSVSIEDMIAKNNVENITNSNNEINKELALIKNTVVIESNKSNESENEHGLVNKNIKTNSSISTDHKKNLEVEDKIIKNNRLSIPKFSSELENILNHRNGNTTNSESIDLVKDNSEKNEKNYNTESEISSNTIDFKSSKTEQKEQTLKEEDQNKENEIVSIPKESTNSKEQNEIITQDPNPFSCTDKTDNEPKIVLSKPNNSFLWRTLSKDNKTTSIVDKAIVNTNTQEKNYQDDVNDYEIYTYIELNAKDKEEKIVKNTSSLHLNNLPSATYQSLPNLSHCEIDDTYEELNYYTEKNYVPEIPEKKFLKEFDEVVPELPEKNRNHNVGNMTWVNASKPDIHINVVVCNSVDNVSKDYQNKNIPDLLKRGDGENLYHEPKFASEHLEEKIREKRQVLTNIADKYATIVKPLKRDHGELNYNYESIVSVKDDSHYISIQDDAEVYDDVLNVIQMDNCYESIKADSECGSFWEKDNSIYGIKAPSVLSNNSTVSTVSAFIDTSDEWVDVDQSDHEDHIFVYLPRKVSRSSTKKKGWIQKVRRQRSKLTNVRQILTPKKGKNVFCSLKFAQGRRL
ncbi:hypothetical protein M8J77_026462 [Diaphorina citri]|nr:hypothetical protein M8J77_026462 [Diaphorina citri]